MSDPNSQLGISIRFIREFDITRDLQHERAWALTLQDCRDVTLARKYADAVRFIAESDANKTELADV